MEKYLVIVDGNHIMRILSVIVQSGFCIWTVNSSTA